MKVSYQKKGASSRWQFGLNSAWGSIATAIIGKKRTTLENESSKGLGRLQLLIPKEIILPTAY